MGVKFKNATHPTNRSPKFQTCPECSSQNYVGDFITVNQSAYLAGHSTLTILHKRIIMVVLDGIKEGSISGIGLFDLENVLMRSMIPFCCVSMA